MGSETKTVFRWFWDNAPEEDWLGEMSRQGWHFVSMDRFGRGYRFARGEPRNCLYRVIFARGNLDPQHYARFFGDSGWTYVWGLSGNHYVRIEGADAIARATRTRSAFMREKYRGRILWCAVFAVVFAVSGATSSDGWFKLAWFALALFLLVFVLILLYRLLQLGWPGARADDETPGGDER